MSCYDVRVGLFFLHALRHRSLPPAPPAFSSSSPVVEPLHSRIRKNKGRWTHEEHEAFLRGLQLYERNWEAVAALVPTRTVLQIRTHSQK